MVGSVLAFILALMVTGGLLDIDMVIVMVIIMDIIVGIIPDIARVIIKEEEQDIGRDIKLGKELPVQEIFILIVEVCGVVPRGQTCRGT